VWETTGTEEAAAWREADPIHAPRPPFNADQGLRSRDPISVGVSRPPFVVVTEVGTAGFLRFALDASSGPRDSTRTRVYGCFPHLGKGVATRLGIACSDGYVALLRLVWAAAGAGTHTPAAITRSAPAVFEVPVANELPPRGAGYPASWSAR
jgi:hypothetical protein